MRSGAPHPQARLALLFGALPLFSGLAVLAHILSRVPLAATLGMTLLIAVIGARVVWTRLGPVHRAAVRLVVLAGVLAGLGATAAYDAARYLLSWWDPSPYNPFEVVRIFGVLLVGTSAPPAATYAAGLGLHLLNGTMFGVGYTLLLGRRGILAGILWAMGLEMFQLTLYPGWLGITFVTEFARISAASHLVYGGTLGALARAGIGRIVERRMLRAHQPA